MKSGWEAAGDEADAGVEVDVDVVVDGGGWVVGDEVEGMGASG